MSLINYNPFKPFGGSSMDRWMNDFFNTELTGLGVRDQENSMPSVNIIENEDSFDIEVAAPGLKKEDFNVQLDNNRLVITGERKVEDDQNEEGKFTRREFNYTRFERSFQISDIIDADKIGATYEDGILTIRLGKKDTAIKKAPKSIEIN